VVEHQISDDTIVAAVDHRDLATHPAGDIDEIDRIVLGFGQGRRGKAEDDKHGRQV
jgi:hypothetical protein